MKLKLLLLDFGSQCNNLCVFCNTPKRPRITTRLKDYRDLDALISCADIVDISGYGEITIHPDFPEIIDRLTAAGRAFDFTTNGVNLDKWLDKLDATSVRKIAVSVNSLVPETYVAMCGADHCLKVLENVDLVLSKPRKYLLETHYAISTLNWLEIPSIIDYTAARKIYLTYINDLVGFREYPPGFRVEDTPQNRYQLCAWRRLAGEMKLHLRIFDLTHRVTDQLSEAQLSKRITTCQAPYKMASITKSGDVMACCSCEIPMGNIQENSLENIWNGLDYQDLRRCLSCGDTKYCKTCVAPMWWPEDEIDS